MRYAYRIVTSVLFLCVTGAGGGCETGRGGGAAAGAGVGALFGAAGGGASGMIRGAGIGAAGGYIIGNESDKDRANQPVTPSDLEPLAGTTWTLAGVIPESTRTFASMVIDFRPDGILFTKRTDKDGNVTTDEEHYRIADNTLIVNDRDYILNGAFILQDRSLTFVVGENTSRWT